MKRIAVLMLSVMWMLSAVPTYAAVYTDNETVMKVQQALNSIGYDCGTPDGEMGNKTTNAIEAYQFDRGLTTTGEIDGYLLASLEYDNIGASTDGGYKYDLLDDGTAVITEYIGGAEKLIIPEKLDGYKVTGIGDSAFFGRKYLTDITIPDTVRSIGASAFSACKSLNSISIPDGVTSIEDRTFESCEYLTSVNIPNSVTSIGVCAFNVCYNLTSITIPDSVTSIGDWAFHMCSGLTSVTIPDSVTSIGEEAFEDCLSLTSISIPDSVTSIGADAFNRCENLTFIVEPGSYAEGYCKDNSLNYTLSVSHEESLDNVDPTVSWGEQIFDKESLEFNCDLALICAQLSQESYTLKTLSRTFRDLKFSGAKSYNYSKSDSLGSYEGENCFYIAHTKMVIAGKETCVIFVVCRGTKELGEMAGDWLKGHPFDKVTDFHGVKVWKNVYDYYDEVKKGIEDYRKRHPDLLDAEKLKIVVTGHSLGGAAANLVGADITFGIGENNWWSDRAAQQDVYVYTFGAIKVIAASPGKSILSDSNQSKGLGNIHNIYNHYDSFGPFGNYKILLASTPFAKFGHTETYKDERFHYEEIGFTFENHDMKNYRSAISFERTTGGLLQYGCEPIPDVNNDASGGENKEQIYSDLETIAKVQTALNEKGYDCGVVDGDAGPKTKEAITRYKADNGLDNTTDINDSLLDSLGISSDLHVSNNERDTTDVGNEDSEVNTIDNTSSRPEPDDVHIAFERISDHDIEFEGHSGAEYAVITATDDNGSVLWTRQTEMSPAGGQAWSVCEIGMQNGMYYYYEMALGIVTLNPGTGDVIWIAEAQAGNAGAQFDDNGNLYCNGLESPIYVISPDGTILHTIDLFSRGYADLGIETVWGGGVFVQSFITDEGPEKVLFIDLKSGEITEHPYIFDSDGSGRYLSTGRYRVYRTDHLKVCKEPNIASEIIGELSAGDIVVVNTSEHYDGWNNGFAEIEYQGGRAYVVPSYLERVDGGIIFPGFESDVMASDITIYGWPSDTSEVIGVIDEGTLWLVGYNQESGFTLVESDLGMGYVKEQFDLE